MVSPIQHSIVQAAEAIYADRLRSLLEPKHDGDFVAIEPDSGDYFLGKTLSEAVGAARRTYPARLTYTMRVGSVPAIHIGCNS